MRIFLHNNQNGMVLVLAMFMMALLSMIGVASMMTTTTDIEIATGEQQYVETFYRTQAAHIIASEVLQKAKWDRGLDGTANTIGVDGEPADFNDITDYTFAFRLLDLDVYQELPDRIVKLDATGQQIKVWNVNEQTVDELPCPQDMTASECSAINAIIGKEDLDLWTDIQILRIVAGKEIVVADIDIDIINVAYSPGGGAEFGSFDLGKGSMDPFKVYNIDARSRLDTGEFNKSPSRQALGLRLKN